MAFNNFIYTGWWYTYPSEKYEFFSWDDDIPYMKRKIKAMFETTNQLLVSRKTHF